MKTNIIQAVLDGRTMTEYANELGISQSNLSHQLAHQLKCVANHATNRADSELSDVLEVRNAFAIRRNPRAWHVAIANTTGNRKAFSQLQPIKHIFRADTVDDAFDIAMSHESITKRDAMVLIYNTTINAMANEL